MKCFLRLSLLLSLLFPAMVAFAGTDNHKGSINITDTVQVSGTQLTPGEYLVKWDGDGPTTQLSILRGSRLITTVPARVVRLDQTPSQSSVELKNSNGVKTMTAIRFEGRTYALELGGDGAGGGASSGSDVK